MIEHDINIRVRYAETDKMGYVYYGNYATYFEVARVETFRSFGLSYADMEKDGVMMPVLELQQKYYKPALYDDLLTIRTHIKVKPAARIYFEYEVFNEAGVKLGDAKTTLVFINMKTGRPCAPPESFQEAVMNRFE